MMDAEAGQEATAEEVTDAPHFETDDAARAAETTGGESGEGPKVTTTTGGGKSLFKSLRRSVNGVNG